MLFEQHYGKKRKKNMSRTRIVGGKITEKIGGDYKIYSKGDIVYNAVGPITMTGVENGVTFGKPEKPPKIKITDLKVTKVEGPFDENMKLVKYIKANVFYTYKATPSRKPTDFELNLLKWAVKNDDKKLDKLSGVASLNQLASDGTIILNIKVTGSEKTKIYAYFNYPSKTVNLLCDIENKYPKVYISTTPSGYTIQKLYGHPAAKDYGYPYEPAVIVSTYKAYLKFFENGETKDIIEFNVTRDAWWYLGIKNHKYELLNRTFEPLEGSENKYLTDEIHFPSGAPKDCRGYFLNQNGKRIIDAEAFETDVDVDNKKIGDNRKEKNKAKNVMLHIGGVYKARYEYAGVEWLGGSLGCFSFIPKNDIYATEELARKASDNDDYDDDLSNSHWLKITNKINELRELDTEKRFFIIINKRTDWVKTKNINFDQLLKE